MGDLSEEAKLAATSYLCDIARDLEYIDEEKPVLIQVSMDVY